MNGYEYERFVSEFLIRNGYSNVTVTKSSGDYGVDVIASKNGHRYAVQCKYYTKPVGLSAIQEVKAGMAYYRCDKAMVITNNSFTKNAKELAKANDVKLLEHIKAGTVKPQRSNYSKLIIWVIYFFITIPCWIGTFQVIKNQDFWLATYNIICTSLVLLCPFWILLLIKLTSFLIRQIRNNKQNNTAGERIRDIHGNDENAESKQMKTIENSTKSENNTERYTQSESIYYADPELIRTVLDDNDCFVTDEQLTKLICLDRLLVSIIGIILKVSYTRAKRITIALEEQGYLFWDNNVGYVWTEYAKNKR